MPSSFSLCPSHWPGPQISSHYGFKMLTPFQMHLVYFIPLLTILRGNGAPESGAAAQ